LKKREGELSKYVSEIARCTECGAYVNPFCDINSLRWFCAICTRRNNYSKAHIRYRHIDPKLVPELKNALVDLDLPLYDNTNVYQVSALKRPLIHLLLVQETMQIDTLEAVRNDFPLFFLFSHEFLQTIDSIRASLPEVHPDIYFILLTYSNQRIGVYLLNSEDDESENTKHTEKDDLSSSFYDLPQDSYNNDVPVVQYTHFMEHSSVTVPIEGRGSQLDEGVVLTNDRISLSTPLSDVLPFPMVGTNIGSCRKLLESSLLSILESSPEENRSISRVSLSFRRNL
jgi:hypothetical protein